MRNPNSIRTRSRAMFAAPAALLFLLSVLAIASCSSSDDIATPGDDPGDDPPEGTADSPPLFDAEPEFSSGTANTLAWTPATAKAQPLEYRIEAATDVEFAALVAASEWTEATEWTFTDLEHAQAYHYRVKARADAETESPWSDIVTSTQDAVAPVAALEAMDEDQTSLMLYIPYTAEDDVSGVTGVELWVSIDGSAFALADTLKDNPGRFRAEGQGRHEFYVVALDAAGNREVSPATAEQSVNVPEPIIIFDRQNNPWDITHAVLHYNFQEELWGYGLGLLAIRPILDPRFIGPGHPAYPDPNNLAIVVGVPDGEDGRAYKLGDLNSREVANDVIPDAHIAVTY